MFIFRQENVTADQCTKKPVYIKYLPLNRERPEGEIQAFGWK